MKKLSYNYIKEQIERIDGYTLLSTEYKTSTEPLSVMCPKGHIFYPMFYNFIKKKTRCNHPTCKNIKISKSNSNTYEKIKTFIEQYEYKLLSTSYKKSIDKLQLKCPLGHIFEMRYSSFHQGQRCPICSNENKRTLYINVKNFIEQYGYKLISKDYINAFYKLKLQCPLGHIFEMKYNSFHQGQRCPICSQSKSKPELEIFNYIKNKYNYNVISGDRKTIINPKTNRFLELDVFIPEIKKAIEYNSTHWHTGTYVEFKDKIKQNECKNKDISLLIITHDKWIKNKDFTIIDNFINQGSGVNIC